MSRTASPLSRREFLRYLVLSSAGATLASCTGRESPPEVAPAEPTTVLERGETPGETIVAQPKPDTPTAPPEAAHSYLSVVRGAEGAEDIDPAALTTAAIAAIGGIERFVQAGHDVIIKPNICTDYHPYEYGATTNPLVVATLVRLCLGAGARRVRVMDKPFAGPAESAYAISGIADAVAEAGGEMELMNPNKYKATAIPDGRDISQVDIYQDILDADCLIDVPICKNHNLVGATLGCKNLLGVIKNPSQMHANLAQRIADLVSLVRPTLTVVDAIRVLMVNGPTGGRLRDVRLANTVIASHDIVAADAYATTVYNPTWTGDMIGYVRSAAEMGLGVADLSAIKIEELSL
jgi:uncharacterized protein (DUF362 family)